METAAIVFATSVVVFTVSAVLVQMEEKRAHRVIGGRVRDTLDAKVVLFENRWTHHWKHLSRYILQLGWYYSIHSLLRALLQVLVSVYTYFERIFEENRVRTKQLRKELKRHVEKSHLVHMAHHKEETTLSKEAQEELLTRKLEQDH